MWHNQKTRQECGECGESQPDFGIGFSPHPRGVWVWSKGVKVEEMVCILAIPTHLGTMGSV